MFIAINTCKGVSNIASVLFGCQERIDIEWQNVRKLAKRGYMRSINEYESKIGTDTISHSNTPWSKARSSPAPNSLDLNSMKREFDGEKLLL